MGAYLRIGILVLAAATLLSGCSTIHGTSFGLPDAVLSAPNYVDADTAVSDLQARNNAYLVAANGAANGTQIFDVPAILAGTAGVAASAFSGVTKDLGPAAGTLAAGALGFRSYYGGASRYGAYVGGARGTSCLLQAATEMKASGLTSAVIAHWRTLQGDAGTSDAPVAADILRVAPLVTSATTRLASGAVRVDTEVTRKLSAPAAPDLSTYMTNYQTAVARGDGERQAMTEAQSKGLKMAASATPFELSASKALANARLLKALEGLDARIEQCVAFAA